MGNVSQISSHPRYQRKIPMEITYTYDWSGIRDPDPKRLLFPRIDCSPEEGDRLESLYAKGILSDSQCVILAEAKEELQTIADKLGVDLDE